MSLPTYDGWVTRLRLACSRRRKSARPTGENVCSLWPTPDVAHKGDRTRLETPEEQRQRHRQRTIEDEARRWASPTSRDWKNDQLPTRTGAAALSRQAPEATGHLSTRDCDLPSAPAIGPWARGHYPTPAANSSGSSQNEGTVQHPRPSAGTPSLQGWAKARLNPLFVAWLMGLPVELISSEPLETQSFRSWRQKHSDILRRS
jgi:hypothetical protein